MRKDLLSLPPLEPLRGFVAAASRRSITLAAADLCLTQSAISRQIQALENALGAPLFVRKHRAIELTPAGERLLPAAIAWLAEYGEIAASLRQRAASANSVTITASIGVTALWLLPRLGHFQATHPTVEVRVVAANSPIDLTPAGIDLAIRYQTEPTIGRGDRLLFRESIAPVLAPVLAKKLAANLEESPTLIEYQERSLPGLDWTSWLGSLGLSGRNLRRLGFNQYDQAVQAAIAGQGVVLGRLPLLADALDDGRLCRWTDVPAFVSPYAYWLLRAPGSNGTAVAAFADWLAGQGKAEPSSLPDSIKSAS
ncbi:DNA-binding transcriptional LysR family regulator [Azonexus fungiphilus]|uniref:DNA-binding transcriptional LysR family regulator n=1 Tax=Azonexus fungiphilus TaxID=146940 RepID=A0A495WAF0_9RHOO|nr:LysR substrate-binding domain-containing protein [Azonexus fungiphilus]RKT58127.1 DNA-binding transcriptional LysR family regulator [Azonexus fungiphilus]